METNTLSQSASELNQNFAALDMRDKRLSNSDLGQHSFESQKQANNFHQQGEHFTERPPKDNWDKIAALAPIISAALIFITGSYCTYTYNQQQIRIQQCQTIEKFIPHLMGNEQTKKAAILALSSLINTETASRFASIFASTGTVSALQSLSQNGSDKDKLVATQALSTALQNLADSESKLTSIEQDYKKVITEKAKQSSTEHDTPYNLNKLAEVYMMHGQYDLAEPLLKRSLATREQVYGSEHPEVVDALKSLAELYQLSGKAELAEKTLRRAREIEEKQGFNQAKLEKSNSVGSTEPSSKTQTQEPKAFVSLDRSPTQAQSQTDVRANDLSPEQGKLEGKQP